MSKLFGTDGIRGIANVELTTNLALKVGKACAKVLKDEDKKLHILIGSDTRISSSMIVSSISAGSPANGCDVTNVGVVPTPCVSYLVKNSIFDAGIMVSASHNSFEFNGIKIFDKNGLKNEKDIVAVILDLCARKYLSLEYHVDKYTIHMLEKNPTNLLSNESYIFYALKRKTIKRNNYKT